jgi:hypothetical protein
MLLAVVVVINSGSHLAEEDRMHNTGVRSCESSDFQ